MTAPKFVLIGRKALTEKTDAIKAALGLLGLSGAIVACNEDAEAAKLITEGVIGFKVPFAIVADFSFPLGVIMDNGSVEPIALPNEQPQDAPLIELAG